jgi:hypothetical protein
MFHVLTKADLAFLQNGCRATLLRKMRRVSKPKCIAVKRKKLKHMRMLPKLRGPASETKKAF